MALMSPNETTALMKTTPTVRRLSRGFWEDARAVQERRKTEALLLVLVAQERLVIFMHCKIMPEERCPF